MSNFQKIVRIYSFGFIFIYIATIVFAAFGWIKIGSSLQYKNLIVSALASLVIWTILFITGEIVLIIGVAATGCGVIFGGFIFAALVGKVLLTLTQFLLPETWFGYKGGITTMVMGIVYCVIAAIMVLEKDELGGGDGGGDEDDEERPDPKPPGRTNTPSSPRSPELWRN